MKKRILTGIKPSGQMQLGNYLGMVRQVLEFQETHELYLMIADLHAQTVPYDSKELRERTLDLAKSMLALGVDPEKLIFFKQSDIPAHLYLYWILGNLAPVGELMRMHEYKEQKERYEHQGIGSGILMYPVLMAADILIYQAQEVPVGEDQVQHVELARELARKFNNAYGETFILPEPKLTKETARVMSLDNPEKKMSKSLPGGNIDLFASEEEIMEKFKGAVTDSENEICFDYQKKPGISNLMLIYKEISEKGIKQIENDFSGKGYGEFKEEVGRALLEYFKKARIKKENIKDSEVQKILEEGAERAQKTTQETLELILKKTGLR